MPDRETWRFINTFAPWFAAFGTITAALVALYLARRSGRPKVAVSAAIVKAFTPGVPMATEGNEFLKIRAVNIGFVDTVLSGMTWRILGLHPQSFVVVPGGTVFSTDLPKRLTHADEATVMFATDTFGKQSQYLLEKIRGSRMPSLTVHFVQVGFYSSTGPIFYTRLDRHLRKWLLSKVRG